MKDESLLLCFTRMAWWGEKDADDFHPESVDMYKIKGRTQQDKAAALLPFSKNNKFCGHNSKPRVSVFLLVVVGFRCVCGHTTVIFIKIQPKKPVFTDAVNLCRRWELYVYKPNTCAQHPRSEMSSRLSSALYDDARRMHPTPDMPPYLSDARYNYPRRIPQDRELSSYASDALLDDARRMHPTPGMPPYLSDARYNYPRRIQQDPVMPSYASDALHQTPQWHEPMYPIPGIQTGGVSNNYSTRYTEDPKTRSGCDWNLHMIQSGSNPFWTNKGMVSRIRGNINTFK